MRLSIWQQFSSNHSANFIVVGTFESAEKADLAANGIREILNHISNWWDNLNAGDRLEWGKRTETNVLTPPELELSEKYQLTWPFSINWYHWTWDRKDDPITVYEHFVFVENPHPYIWYGPQPFDGLMNHFGGTLAIDSSESRSHSGEILLLDVRCKLPSNDEAAELLYESFREDFMSHKTDSNEANENNPNIQFPFNYDVIKSIMSPDIRTYEVERNGDDLHLYGINITELVGLSKALPKLTDWLLQEGCTGIQYTFRSFPVLGH